jgi:hypothetical protein
MIQMTNSTNAKNQTMKSSLSVNEIVEILLETAKEITQEPIEFFVEVWHCDCINECTGDNSAHITISTTDWNELNPVAIKSNNKVTVTVIPRGMTNDKMKYTNLSYKVSKIEIQDHEDCAEIYDKFNKIVNN